MENKLELLDRVKKVDAPPFLWTRVQQRIKQRAESNFTPSLSWGISICLTVVILANGLVFANSFIESKREKNLLQSMNLLPQNSLYK